MIKLNELSKYREGNRIEAKKAAAGLPKSLWETYSAFANTNGGVILLGVGELADKSLSAIGLPEPEKLVSDFWNTLNNREKTSDKKQATTTTNTEPKTKKSDDRKRSILNYLSFNADSTSKEVAEHLAISHDRARVYLQKLASDGIVIAEGENRIRRYRLSNMMM